MVYGQDQSYQDIPNEVVRKVDPSVVAIQHERAGGSGFIVSEDGYILSNGHVVQGDDKEDPMKPATSITVILHDERKFSAKVVGFCMNPDVSVLKIDCPDPLVPVTFGDSENAHIGQKVFAVGMPHGLKRTFSSGILSNVDRTDLGTYTKVIQTDAAINPGNSGGPLFDRNGHVLGINTYGTRGANNLGFTIPIHVAAELYEDILAHGRFIRSDIPILFARELYEELRDALGVEDGVLVEYVMEGSPAEEAGFKMGDVIVEQNGKPVSARTKADLLDYAWDLTILEPGTQVTFGVLRRGDEGLTRIDISAVLEESEPMVDTGRFPGEIKTEKYDALGLSFKQIVRLHRIFHELQDDKGVLVEGADRGSPAEEADLHKYDIITHVAGTAVEDVASFRAALEKALSENTQYIELRIRRQQLEWRTALAPYYDLGDQHVVVLLPPGDANHVDLVLRELISQGADLTVVYPDGTSMAENVQGVKVSAISEISASEVDVLLLLDGSQADYFLDNQAVSRLIQDVYAEEKLLAAVGRASIALLDAEPALLEKKMTTSEEYSGDAIQKNAQYTGNEVERDGGMLTTTGLDREVMRAFLKELALGN
jgi:serine protease Do